LLTKKAFKMKTKLFQAIVMGSSLLLESCAVSEEPKPTPDPHTEAPPINQSAPPVPTTKPAEPIVTATSTPTSTPVSAPASVAILAPTPAPTPEATPPKEIKKKKKPLTLPPDVVRIYE
jgi:hypothetical protein